MAGSAFGDDKSETQLSSLCLVFSQSSLFFYFISRFCRGEQVHVLCGIEELIPVIGNSVPLPSLLSLLISQFDSTLQNIRKVHSDPVLDGSKVDDSFYFSDGDAFLGFKTHFISISDDGKIWSWILSVKRDTDSNLQSNDKRLNSSTDTFFEVYG